MNKYLVIYHAPKAEVKGMKYPSEEEKMAAMKPWMDWKVSMGDNLIDFGNPVMGGKKLSADGSSSESQKEVAGYSFIQAKSYEEALELLKGHPHLASGACEIEVHEAIAM